MFLPKDYEAPRSISSGYMKLQDGENRIRILSQPIIGWEDWTFDKKPVRYRYNNKPEKSIDPKKPVKHFWAFIVWNYSEEQIQVLQISQATIRKSLEKLCKDSDWGAPYFYDIKIVKEGESKDTEYTVNPVSHKPVSQEIIDCFNERPCYLEALFDNADPYSSNWDSFTQGIFKKEDIKEEEMVKSAISPEKALQLSDLLNRCDPKYKETVWDALGKNKIVRLEELTPEMYDRLEKAASKKAKEYNQEVPF